MYSPLSTSEPVVYLLPYTKTCLSYQTHILNAVKGLFTTFLRYHPHVRQLWDISTDLTAYWPVSLADKNLTPSLNAADNLYATAASRLSWVIASNVSIERRRDELIS
jgi:hypothetical protein